MGARFINYDKTTNINELKYVIQINNKIRVIIYILNNRFWV